MLRLVVVAVFLSIAAAVSHNPGFWRHYGAKEFGYGAGAYDSNEIGASRVNRPLFNNQGLRPGQGSGFGGLEQESTGISDISGQNIRPSQGFGVGGSIGTGQGSGFGQGSGIGGGSGFGQGVGIGQGSGFGQGSSFGQESGFGQGSSFRQDANFEQGGGFGGERQFRRQDFDESGEYPLEPIRKLVRKREDTTEQTYNIPPVTFKTYRLKVRPIRSTYKQILKID